MCHCHAKSFLLLLLIASGFSVFAQTTPSGSNPLNGRDNNPYSKYGIGELVNGNSTVLRGMGNITSAYANAYKINTDNPASYSFLERTTFEVGAVASSRTVHGTLNGVDQSYKSGTATVAYLNMAVPINKRGGLSFGFRPYSHVYYALQDTIFTGSTPSSPIGRAVRSYRGEGGLNQAFMGGSFRYKGLSAGINVGYLFGTIQNASYLFPDDTFTVNKAFNSAFTNYTRIGGVHWKGGLQYEMKLDSTHYLRLGGTLAMGQKLKQHFSEYHIITYNLTDTFFRDTSVNITEQEGKLTMPVSYSIGVMLGRKDKWAFGIDYAATQWSGFNSELNPSMNAGIASSSYKVSIGGEYTPDAENLRRYLSRGTYRIGAYYGTDYLKLQNLTLPYYGITVGASLPFRRSLSQIHMAIDGGVLGTTASGLNKQNYLRVTFGISLNDLWFVKRALQ